MAAETRVTHTNSPEATRLLGKAIGQSLAGGEVIGLIGPLGAGKTQLVKGIAIGNGWPDSELVTSPTFTLVHEYAGKCVMFHVDVYRLRDLKELQTIGFHELMQPWSAVVVEWANRVAEAMPQETIWVEISIAGETARILKFRADGVAAKQWLNQLDFDAVDTSA